MFDDNQLDQLHRAAHVAGVTFASLVFGGATEASGASAYVALATMAYTVPNLAPGTPFNRAGGEWGNLATKLETKKTELESAVQQIRGGGDDLWKGPGAEAFVGYVEDEIIPSIEALTESSEQTQTVLDDLASSCTDALIQFYAITTVGTTFALAANALNSIPVVGPGLAVAAKWYIAIGWFGHLVIDLISLVLDFESHREIHSQLGDVQGQLAEQFGSEGDRLDSEALDRKRQQIDSILSEPSNWGKA